MVISFPTRFLLQQLMTETDSAMSVRALRSNMEILLNGPQFEGIEFGIELIRDELQATNQGDLISRTCLFSNN